MALPKNRDSITSAGEPAFHVPDWKDHAPSSRVALLASAVCWSLTALFAEEDDGLGGSYDGFGRPLDRDEFAALETVVRHVMRQDMRLAADCAREVAKLIGWKLRKDTIWLDISGDEPDILPVHRRVAVLLDANGAGIDDNGAFSSRGSGDACVEQGADSLDLLRAVLLGRQLAGGDSWSVLERLYVGGQSAQQRAIDCTTWLAVAYARLRAERIMVYEMSEVYRTVPVMVSAGWYPQPFKFLKSDATQMLYWDATDWTSNGCYWKNGAWVEAQLAFDNVPPDVRSLFEYLRPEWFGR